MRICPKLKQGFIKWYFKFLCSGKVTFSEKYIFKYISLIDKIKKEKRKK